MAAGAKNKMPTETQREYAKQYYQKNKKKIELRRRKYRAANKEKVAELDRKNGRKYWAANREKELLRGRKYYAENREKEIKRRTQYRDANKEKENKYRQEYYESHKEDMQEYYKKRYQENKEHFQEYSRTYYHQNIEERRKYTRIYHKTNGVEARENWNKANLSKLRLYAATRTARKRNATPSWLTEQHKNEIAEVYAQAVELEKRTGVPYHVDHIVPLQGKNVCGLHVPWNLQVLTATQNRSKGNKIK